MRRIDPMVAWERLIEHPEFVEERHLPAAARGEPEAIRVVCSAVRSAFDLQELTDGQDGLTRMECSNLLADYYDYLDALKKNIDPPAMTSSPTDSASSGESSMNAESDSGSIENAPKSDDPPASSSQSETRSDAP